MTRALGSVPTRRNTFTVFTLHLRVDGAPYACHNDARTKVNVAHQKSLPNGIDGPRDLVGEANGGKRHGHDGRVSLLETQCGVLSKRVRYVGTAVCQSLEEYGDKSGRRRGGVKVSKLRVYVRFRHNSFPDQKATCGVQPHNMRDNSSISGYPARGATISTVWSFH